MFDFGGFNNVAMTGDEPEVVSLTSIQPKERTTYQENHDMSITTRYSSTFFFLKPCRTSFRLLAIH